MEMRCPGCSHPIAIPAASGGDGWETVRALSSVECPNCGLVSLEGSEPLSTIAQVRGDDHQDKRIAHFTLVRRLGGGSFGSVWLARDDALHRNVALKLPVSDVGEASHLVHEAQTAASLRHPNIVSIYEAGTVSGRAFIASEFIDGLTLRDFLTTGRPSIGRTVELLTPVAQALHHAHEHGVVHRDVKPANIFLNKQGQPFVADFGLAKRISAEATISSEGQVIGTARYMSPEQAGGKTRDTDRRSDIYALGTILFEMLTGETPFRGNVRALLHQKVVDDPPSPRKLNPALPKDLETICLKCLEREPGRRYQAAGEVAEELTRFAAGDPIQARPISTAERAWRMCRRRPLVSNLVAALFFSLTLGLLGVSFFWLQAKQNTESAQQSLYRSQMNLAAKYLESGDIAGVRHTLRRYGDGAPFSRLRGFEWRYFNRVAQQVVDVANLGDVIHDVAVSHDGGVCAACGNESRIRVWDARSGELIRTLSIPAGQFRSLSFSPISSRLAGGSSDGMIRVWNPLSDDRPLLEIKHGKAVSLVRYSPAGNTLLSAGPAGAVRVWSVTDGSLVAEIPAGMSGMSDACFSPGGEQVVVASRDGALRLWNTASPERPRVLSTDSHVTSLSFSDDGQMIAAGSYQGALRIWSAEDGTLQQRHQMLAGVGDVEFLRESRVLAIAASDGALHLYDVDARHEVSKVCTHNLSLGLLARSADGRWLAVASGDGAVKRVQAKDLLLPTVFWHDENVRAAAFLPDSRRVVAADPGALKIWDAANGESQNLSGDHGSISTVSVHPGGKLIAAAGAAATVTLWNVEDLNVIDQIEAAPGGVATVAFFPTGRRLAVATRQGPILVYEVGKWREPHVRIESAGPALLALAVSPDETELVATLADGGVRCFDSATGAEDRPRLQLEATARTLCFAEEGRLLAVGADTGEIHLWDWPSQKARFVLKAHSGRVSALAAMPGGRTLVSAGRDRDLKLFDTATGEAITSLPGHVRQVHCLAISPDGATLASGGLEGDLRIWRSR